MPRPIFLFLMLLAAISFAAEPARPFSQTLSPDQKQRLGLAGLSAAQWVELDAVIGAYTRGETTVAVQQAVQQVEQRSVGKVREAEKKVQLAEAKAAVAAETAVVEYKKQEASAVPARPPEGSKKKPDETSESFRARVIGPFRGWDGGTYFPLENGQVWRQVGSESNALPPVEHAEVEIYKSKSGYWRLSHQGAWITVKRLQ